MHAVHGIPNALEQAAPVGVQRTHGEGFEALCKSWFSQRRSSEAMMRGSKNEHVMLSKLASSEWIHGLYQCSMLADVDSPRCA